MISHQLFLDLEHELDHIDQILTRFFAQGSPFYTAVFEESSRGHWRENQQYPGVLRNWQNTISEYHVRLLEFKRLHEREIDEPLLREHARQVVIWSQKYFNATGLGKSSSKTNWEAQFFPDLQTLRTEVNQLFLQTGVKFAEWEVTKNRYKEVRPL